MTERWGDQSAGPGYEYDTDSFPDDVHESHRDDATPVVDTDRARPEVSSGSRRVGRLPRDHDDDTRGLPDPSGWRW